MELVGSIYRTVFGVWYQAAFSIGGLVLLALAYYFREWKPIGIAAGVSVLLQLPFFW